MNILVVYEVQDKDGVFDEINIFDCDNLKGIKDFLEHKHNTKTSLANLSKIIKRQGTINKRYKIYKVNIEEDKEDGK
jgi:hypothetical protein